MQGVWEELDLDGDGLSKSRDFLQAVGTFHSMEEVLCLLCLIHECGIVLHLEWRSISPCDHRFLHKGPLLTLSSKPLHFFHKIMGVVKH